jgi:hypothetical protein
MGILGKVDLITPLKTKVITPDGAGYVIGVNLKEKSVLVCIAKRDFKGPIRGPCKNIMYKDGDVEFPGGK